MMNLITAIVVFWWILFLAAGFSLAIVKGMVAPEDAFPVPKLSNFTRFGKIVIYISLVPFVMSYWVTYHLIVPILKLIRKLFIKS